MKKRHVRSWLLPLGFLALGIGGCDSTGPETPVGPGFLLVTLLSPAGEEGSAVFELAGGEGLGSVYAVDGEVFSRRSGGATRVVAVMNEPGAVQFRIRTENVGELPEVEILQVADGANQLRSSVEGYDVAISQEEDSSR